VDRPNRFGGGERADVHIHTLQYRRRRRVGWLNQKSIKVILESRYRFQRSFS
jgi:hypothetical protein